VLFDGKHQKNLTKVIAIVAIVAFLGFGLVAGFLAVGGGCGAADPLTQAVNDARTSVQQGKSAVAQAQKAVKQSPKSAQAKEDLAQARSDLGEAQITLAQATLAVNRQDPQALTNALAAAKSAPGNLDVVLGLVTVATTQNNPAAALPALQAYTSRNPKDSQAYAYWGQVAEQAGQRNQAILAYQRFLQLAPDDTLAADIRNRLAELSKPVTTTG
jgi:tetratricopeptide (TPR) repeat protein